MKKKISQNKPRTTNREPRTRSGFTPTLTFFSFFSRAGKRVAQAKYIKNISSLLGIYTKNARAKRKLVSGFTLIEIIVAVGIFSIVMLIAVGALLSVISANRNARATETIVNNLNFALESMTREIRVGTTYHCGEGVFTDVADCDLTSGGADTFAFEKSGGDSQDGSDQVVFRLNNGRIEKSDEGGSSNSFLPITSPSMNVENLTFYVYNATDVAPNNRQPKVVIVIQGEVESQQGESDDFNVQTAVTQRLLD